MYNYNVLILGMGGDVSKGIRRALALSEIPCRVIGACVDLASEGLYLCDTAYIAPYAADEKFIPWLIELCSREQVDLVLTGVEENVKAISEHLTELREQTKAVFRVSSPEQLRIGGDKLKTCQWLEAHGFPTPDYAQAEDVVAVKALVNRVGFPLFAKPRTGKGSSGVFQIQAEEELGQLEKLDNYVVEECVGTPEQEYTVGCYRGLDGIQPEPIVMRRTLKHGASWMVEVVENEAICELSKKICKAFLPDGPLNIQLRLDKSGMPVPFELNVRFSGTTPMRAHFGFCDVKAMMYESLMNKEIMPCFAVRTGTAYRYTQEIYLADKPSCEADGKVSWTPLMADE